MDRNKWGGGNRGREAKFKSNYRHTSSPLQGKEQFSLVYIATDCIRFQENMTNFHAGHMAKRHDQSPIFAHGYSEYKGLVSRCKKSFIVNARIVSWKIALVYPIEAAGFFLFPWEFVCAFRILFVFTFHNFYSSPTIFLHWLQCCALLNCISTWAQRHSR